MIKGLLLASVIALLAQFISHMPLMHHWAISSLVIAMLLGMIIGNVMHHRLQTAQPGLRFAQNRVLRAGVILFGFNLTIAKISQLGWQVLVLDTLVVTVIMLVGYWLGTRVLKMHPEATLLTCAGSAICGAAAVLATEGVVKAKQEHTAMAVATVILFGTASMLIYPHFFISSGLGEQAYGIYIGSTMHEVAQVIAAAQAVGPNALDTAVVVKLLRVALLIPFLLLVIRLFPQYEAETGTRHSGFMHAMPWFVIGFALCVLINSWLTLNHTLLVILTTAAQWGLTIAMTALGLNTRLSSLKALGARPLVLAAVLFVLLTVGGMALNMCLIRQ